MRGSEICIASEGGACLVSGSEICLMMRAGHN